MAAISLTTMPKSITCEFCHKEGLTWVEYKAGTWRLRDPDGKIHPCLSDKAEALAAESRARRSPYKLR